MKNPILVPENQESFSPYTIDELYGLCISRLFGALSANFLYADGGRISIQSAIKNHPNLTAIPCEATSGHLFRDLHKWRYPAHRRATP